MREDISIFLFDDFEKCDDPVKTEQEIFDQISNRTVLTNYAFAALPLAWNINHRGLQHTQNMIDQICINLKQKEIEKFFFVCQHIQVNNLNFHGQVVFSPHATKMDSYQAIPHYSANYGKLGKPLKERKIHASFMGAFKTHYTRQQLSFLNQVSQVSCKVIDTGDWHFYKKDKQLQDFKQSYEELLDDTVVSLCPRGTGPSTIRIWESMASGCVPLIISDYLSMPMEKIFDWNEMAIFVPENDIKNVLDYVPSVEELQKMADLGRERYWKFFSNDNLYKSIIQML